jgi:hypothetical protein
MTVSLAADGAGPARRMLSEAGFGGMLIHSAPGLTRDLIYVTGRPD